MDEAMWRIEAFAEAGADMLFIDALESKEEMIRFCSASGAAARLPKVSVGSAHTLIRMLLTFRSRIGYPFQSICIHVDVNLSACPPPPSHPLSEFLILSHPP